MIKKISLLLFVLSLFLSGNAKAQMFQNSNVACEVREVSLASTANSVTCRSYSEIADFDSNTYADCVVEEADWNTIGEENVGILINNGSGSVCGSGAGQFATAVNYEEDNTSSGTNGIATAIAGPLSPGARSSIFVPYTNGGSTSMIAFDTPNASGIFPESESYVTGLFGIFGNGFASDVTNRSTAMFDCNNDNYQDVFMLGMVSSAVLSTDVVVVDVLVNDQAGSFTLTSQASVLNVTGASGSTASIAVGDFNNDGIPDLASAVDTKNGAVDPQIVTCINDGVCGFTCTSVINLVTEHSGSSALDINIPTIAAGDFDGDEIDDLVVGVRDTQAANPFVGLDYYINQGSNTYASRSPVTVTNTNTNIPDNITTGYFNNDDVLDVAGTLLGDNPVSGTVQVVTSNGEGGFNTALELNFTTDPTTDIVDQAWGLDAANFDQQGCDDIIALGTGNATRNAYLFMNTVETLTVSAGTSQTVESSSVQLTGTCSLNPEDTTTTASSIVPTWTVLSGPAGGSFNNANSLTPIFTASNSGDYVFQLSCVSRCVAATTSTVNVRMTFLLLEGQKICSFDPFAIASFSWTGILMMFASLGVFWGLRIRK